MISAVCQGLLSCGRHIGKREDPGDEVAGIQETEARALVRMSYGFCALSRGARNHSFLVGIQKHEKHNQQKPRWDRIWANEQPSIRLLSKKCPEPRLKHKEKTRIFFILDVLLVAPLQQTQMPRASIDA